MTAHDADDPDPGGANQKLTIAFIYNIRHQYPDPNDPRTQLEADFDDEYLIRLIIRNLKDCDFNVIPIEANEKAYFKLYRNRHKIDLAFNFSEGIYGKSREGHIPAILEMLKIPYTGCSSLTQNIIFNKAKTKEILVANGIPTAPHQLFKTPYENLNRNLRFPLIVKPVAQGSSAGITNDSLVFNEQQLKKQIKFVIETFDQEALVETFLDGREFSIAMLGNPPRILSIVESNHKDLPEQYNRFDSLEVKWFYEDSEASNHFLCPAKVSDELYEKLEKICLQTWQALDITDWCRIDIRCDSEGNPNILEVNSPAGIAPPEANTSSYYVLAAQKSGIDYKSLLKTIINSSLKRYATNNCVANLETAERVFEQQKKSATKWQSSFISESCLPAGKKAGV